MPSKETIHLHIGMHKTGSTSIQSSLEGFTDGTTRYARLGRRNHSFPVNDGFRSHRKNGQPMPAARRQQARAQLLAELQSPEPNLIISGESIPRLPHEDLHDLRDTLAAHSRHIHVIAYLREPYGYVTSAFQQRVKTGKIAPDLSLPLPEYRNRFEPVLRIFGPETVSFIPFQPSGFRNGCLITDFCDRVGVDADAVPKRRKNESLSPEVISWLLQLNAQDDNWSRGPKEPAFRMKSIMQLAKVFPGKLDLHPDLITPQLDPGDQDWMEDTAGFALPAASPVKEGAIASLDALRQCGTGKLPELHAHVERLGGSVPSSADAPLLLRTLFRLTLDAQQKG